MAFSIVDTTETLPRIQRRVSSALAAESGQLRGVSGVQEKCFSIVDEHNAWVGSVTGYTLYGSLVIDMLWIEKGYRRVGHGRELVKKIKSGAKAKAQLLQKYRRWNGGNPLLFMSPWDMKSSLLMMDMTKRRSSTH